MPPTHPFRQFLRELREQGVLDELLDAWSDEFDTWAAVLDPTPDTQTLATAALTWLDSLFADDPDWTDR